MSEDVASPSPAKGCGPVPCASCTINKSCFDAFGLKKEKPSRYQTAAAAGKTYTQTHEMIDSLLDHGFRTQITEMEVVNKETGRKGIRTHVEYFMPKGGAFQLDDPISPYPVNTNHWEPSCSVCTFGVSGRCSLKVQKSEVVWIELEDDPDLKLNDDLKQMPDDVFSWMENVQEGHTDRHCINPDGSECEFAQSCTDFLWRSEVWKGTGEWAQPCPHTDLSLITTVLQEQRYIANEVEHLAVDERRICIECDRKCELREKIYNSVRAAITNRSEFSERDNWPTCPWDTAPKRDFQRLWRSDVKPTAEVSANGTCRKFIHIKISQRRTVSFGQPFNAFRDYAWFLEWLDGQPSITRKIELFSRVLSGLEETLRPTKVPTLSGGEELKLVKRAAFSYIPYDQPFIPDLQRRRRLIASTLGELKDECKVRLSTLLGESPRKKILEKIERLLRSIAQREGTEK